MGVESFFYPKLTTIPPPWQGSSFTRLGVLWIMSNNFFTPTDCKLKKIKDLGAIKNSLEEQGISLFDRHVVTESNSTKTLTKIARSVALLGVFVFVAPLESIWHLGNCVYYTVVWMKGGGRTDLIKHLELLFENLLWSSPHMLVACISFRLILTCPHPNLVECLAISLVGSLALTATMYITALILVAWFGSEPLHPPWLMNTWPSIPIPIHLKTKFGLVGEDGWLLTFDEAVDDITVEESKSGGYVVVSGYFNSLWEEQASQMLLACRQVIDTLQLELNKEKIEEFSKNPASFLPYIQDYCKNGNLLQCKTELESSVSKIDQLLKNYTLISGVLDKLLGSHKIKGTSFPYGPEVCRGFFSLYTENSQLPDELLEEFNKRLADIQEMILVTAGPSKGFIETKQKILDGTNPYDILGLVKGVSESTYKKAYFQSAKQVYPDKLPPAWKQQGDELFKVMDAAYKYVISTYTQKTHQKTIVKNIEIGS